MLIDQYRAGRRADVWRQLRDLGEAVRADDTLSDALAVARETMARVRQNVELLVERLRSLGYQFSDPANAHAPPSDRDLQMLAEIEQRIGPMPLSFRAFHEVVGSVNFCQSRDQLVQWQHERRPMATEIEVLGEEDPLVVWPLAHLYDDLMTDANPFKRRGRYAKYGWREGGENRWYYCFSPDEFHKAYYSGGENYNLFVPDPCADFRIRDLFLGIADDEEDREWFVDHLRNVFSGGGFRGKYDEEGDVCRKRLPKSTLSEQLRVGLLEI